MVARRFALATLVVCAIHGRRIARMALRQPDDKDAKLAAFTGAYGRLCRLGAQALDAGLTREVVRVASAGKGYHISPHASELRRQRAKVDRALAEAALAGNFRADIVEAALRVKGAVEGEWGCRIPIVSGGAR